MSKYSLIMNEKHDGLTREEFDAYVNDYMVFLSEGKSYGGKYRLSCLCSRHSGVMIDVEKSKDLFEIYFNTTLAQQRKLHCARLDAVMKVVA